MMNWKKRKRAVSAIAIALAFMCMVQEMLCTVLAQAAELPTTESVSELTEKYEKALESADAAISDAQKEDESAREGEQSGMLPGKSKDNGISDAERARSGEEELGVGTSGESVRYAGKKPKLNKKSLKLTVGESATLKVSGTSKKVKWASSNKKVASVSAKGVVTAKKAGTAKITAKVSGKKLTCSVTVKEPEKPEFSASTSQLDIQDSGVVEITYAGSGRIWYHNSNTKVCSCEWEEGWDGDVATLYVRGIKTGESVITITNEVDDRELSIKVTVTKPIDNQAEKEKLRDYILTNGETNDDGSKYISSSYMYDGSLRIFSITYQPSEDMFEFYFMCTDPSVSLSMELPCAATPETVLIEFLNVSASVLARAEIQPETYVRNSDVDFEVVFSANGSGDWYTSQLAESCLDLAMQRWNNMLINDVGTSLQGIGFSNYDD